MPTVRMGLLLIRVVTGIAIFMHGYQKIFDNGISATQSGFDAMGVPFPEVSAVLLSFLQLFGGAALLVSVLTPVIGVLLGIDMIAAFFIVHVDAEFFSANGGFELVLILAATAFGLALTKPEALADDFLVGLPRRAESVIGSRLAEQ